MYTSQRECEKAQSQYSCANVMLAIQWHGWTMKHISIVMLCDEIKTQIHSSTYEKLLMYTDS